MTGIITSLPPLVEQPPGNNSNNPAGLPGVTYTAAIPTLTQTWTGLQTFTTGSMEFAGSTSGNTFLNATAIASGVLTLPAATDTLVAQNTVDTLTNKTLTNPIINGGTFTPTTFTVKDNAFTLQDDGDVTKQAVFQLSGISTATTRTLTLQDSSGTIALTGNNLSVFAATTSAQLRGVLSDETGTGFAYFQGGDLGTPSAGVLSSATGLPISTGVSGLGTGIATFLATPSSANLRAALTDEVGTGAAYFVGGALGTPASGTATNLTGLPLSGLTTQAAYTIVANATGGSAVPTAMDVTALTSKPSPVSGDIVLIQDSAASNAFKKTTVGALASAGSVASINGKTGALSYSIVIRSFTTPGTSTYTPTTGTVWTDVECKGSGGGGGGVAGATGFGGAGGGGEGSYSKVSVAVASSTGLTITVGAAGTAGAAGANNGGAGNDSSLGAICVGKGGALGGGAAANANGVGGAGGVLGTGTIRNSGGNGASGIGSGLNTTVFSGAQGGRGALGILGRGGDGGFNYASNVATAGNAGEVGSVVITEYLIN